MTLKPLLSKPLSLTFGLAFLAGCSASPTLTSLTVGSQAATSKAAPSAGVTTAATAQTTPFATVAVTAAVTPATVVTAEADAKAVASNDEKLMESLSAALESDELDASVGYTVASVEAVAFPAIRTVLNARQARPPVRQPRWEPAQAIMLAERRARTIAAQQSFEREHPQYADESAAMRKAVHQQTWQPNAEDDTTLCRQGSTTERTRSGARRTVAMTRVVGKAKPHFLVQSTIEVEETGNGTTKTITWERTLQADGSCHIVFHHEYTSPDGRLWVTDWEKILTMEGTLSGTGFFQQCDRRGRRVKEDRLVIGGNDRLGQKVACVPAPAPSPSVSIVPTAVPSESPSVEVSASPTPEPMVVCRTGAVTGGGRLANSNYAFGFGPEVISISDVTEGGVELKADVADVIYDGHTATLTGKLRAPGVGTVTLVVTDNGEGTHDPDDTVTFLTGATVTASGPISRGEPGGGNVQVRNDCD